eukprot:3355006-Amphidinium_carterae.1
MGVGTKTQSKELVCRIKKDQTKTKIASPESLKNTYRLTRSRYSRVQDEAFGMNLVDESPYMSDLVLTEELISCASLSLYISMIDNARVHLRLNSTAVAEWQ